MTANFGSIWTLIYDWLKENLYNLLTKPFANAVSNDPKQKEGFDWAEFSGKITDFFSGASIIGDPYKDTADLFSERDYNNGSDIHNSSSNVNNNNIYLYGTNNSGADFRSIMQETQNRGRRK